MNKQELILAISQIADEVVKQAQKYKKIKREFSIEHDHLLWVISCRLRNLELDLRELQELVRDESE